MTYWHRVYDAIYPNDTTRLITPTADFRHTRVYNDDGTRDKPRYPPSRVYEETPEGALFVQIGDGILRPEGYARCHQVV